MTHYDYLKVNQENVSAAYRFAEKAHAGQKRKYSGADYFTHPVRVALHASRCFANHPHRDALIAAALLHDVVEDCGVTLDELENMFGPIVAKTVDWLTNPSKESKACRAERKAMDRAHAAQAPWEVKAIKLMDRIDNLLEIDPADKFAVLYSDESELLCDALITPETFDLAKELGLVISGLRQELRVGTDNADE